MLKVIALLSIFLIMSCTKSESYHEATPQVEIIETCTFPIRTSENKHPQDLVEPDACIKKKILKLIYEHAPTTYHKEDVNFALYRSATTGFVIYVSRKPIPPQPILKPPLRLFGNWTDSPLYNIEIYANGNFRKGSYVR